MQAGPGCSRYLGLVKSWVRAALALTIAIGGIVYSSWLLEFVLPVKLDPTTSFLSQLDELGHPYRWVFSWADTFSGSLMVVSAVSCLLLLPRKVLTTTGWVAVAMFGGATIADSRFPVGCVPSRAHPCPGQPSGLFPQLHHMHAMTSTIAVVSIFVAMAAFTWAAFRYHRWPLLRTLGLALFIVTAVTTAWMMIADNLAGDYQLGTAQRIQVGGMSLWLVALAVTVWRSAIRRPTEGIAPGS